MTDEELTEALRGLFAHDMGARHLGTWDERLRARCIAELHTRRTADDWDAWLARTVRDMWLSEEAIAGGYDAREAALFLGWLVQRMGCPLDGADPASRTGYAPGQRKAIGATAKGKTVESLEWKADADGYWALSFADGTEVALRYLPELAG